MTKKGLKKGWMKYIWPFAIWPFLIIAYLLTLPSPHGYTEVLIHRLFILLGGLTLILLFTAVIRRNERGFISGVILSIAALSFAIDLHNPGVITSILLFSILIGTGELTVDAIRLSHADIGREEQEKAMAEFLRGPGLNITKITVAVILISTAILLFLPIIAIRTASTYAIITAGALAGITGYYIITH